MWDPESVVILSGRSDNDRGLAEEIAGIIGLPASSCVTSMPGSGSEVRIQLGCNIRSRAVFLVQSTCDPVNDNLIELSLILSACKRASARYVCAIAPYLAYGRQTCKAKGTNVPISGADVASLLEEVGLDAIVTLGVHDDQTAGFYSPRCVFANLSYVPVAARFLVRKGLSSPVVVSPNATGVNRAMEFVEALRLYEAELGMYEDELGTALGARAEKALAEVSLVEKDSGGGGGGEEEGGGGGPGQSVGEAPTDRRSWGTPPSLAMLLTVERRGIKELELTGDVTGRDAILVDGMIDSTPTQTLTRTLPPIRPPILAP